MTDLASMRVVRHLTRESGAGDNLGLTSKPREKGLWNFLTWSFFISQVLVTEQALGAPARAGGAIEDSSGGSQGGADQGAHRSLAGPDGVTHADTSLPGAMVATYPVASAGEILPVMLAAATVDPSTDAALGLHDEPPGHQDGVYQDGAATVADAQSCLGHDGGSQSPDPGCITDVLDPIAPVIDPIGGILDPILSPLPPVIEAVGDLLDPILHQLPPVLGAVGDILETVVGVVEPVIGTVEHALEPVTALLGNVTHAIEPVLEQVTAPFGEVLGNATHALEPILEQVAAPLEPLLETVGNLTGSLSSLLGSGSMSATHAATAPIVATSSSLDLTHTAFSGGLLNDLFSGGQYTQYNIALQSHDAGPSEPIQPHAGASSLQSLVDHLKGPAGESHDSHTDQWQGQTISLHSVLDDIALRGLGDGIV